MMPDEKNSTVGQGMPGMGMMPEAEQNPSGDLETRIADLETRIQALENAQAPAGV